MSAISPTPACLGIDDAHPLAAVARERLESAQQKASAASRDRGGGQPAQSALTLLCAAPGSSAAGARRRASPRTSGPECACAIAVVKRSSQVSTGTARRAARPRRSARVSAACGPSCRRARSAGRPAPRRPRCSATRRATRASPARSRVEDRIQRRGERPRRVADRTAAAGAAVVERQDARVKPAQPSFDSIAPRRGERLVQLLGVAAAGLRHRVAAAATAADHLRRLAHDLHRREAALGRGRREVGHQIRPPVGGGAEHDRGVTEPRLEPVGELQQILAVRQRRSGRSRPSRRRPPPRLRDSARELARARRRRRTAARARARLRARQHVDSARGASSGRVRSRAATSPSASSRARSRRTASGPGHRLDAAHVRGARSLGDDLEEPISESAHVRAAAELARDALDLDHAHLVAVLLPEQGHRAHLLGPRAGRVDRAHRWLSSDPLVDAVLDRPQLSGESGLPVREVEAQLVRAAPPSRPAARACRGARAGPRAAGGWRCGCTRSRGARAGRPRAARARPARSSPRSSTTATAWSSPSR